MREMKDSGVAWLGDIDSRFDIKAIGNLFTIKKDIIGREPDQVLSITQRGIKIKDTTSNEGQNAASYAHYQIVNVGDFAMNHMDLLTGWVDISRYEGVTSPDYRVFTLTDNTQIPEYFLRVFQMYYSNRVFYAFGQGAANLGRWRLPRENFVKIAIPCPPVELQRKIVDEIAAKVSKVDALIANQQAQIEKLKQYKQSLITEVVTKGLEPNAPMKDSGIEWLETIPKCWQVAPLKSLFTFGKGLPITKDNLIESGVPVISYGQIHAKWNSGVTIHEELKRFVSDDYLSTNPNSLVKKGDFIMADTSEDREGCGNCAYVDSEGQLFAGYHTIILNSIEGSNNKYLAYLFRTDAWRSQIRKRVSGVKLFSISRRILGDVSVVLPPEEEVHRMLAFLDDKCSKVDKLVTIKQRKIEELNRYKKALIYEYVTGKKEVV